MEDKTISSEDIMKVTAKNIAKLPDGKHSVAPNLSLVVRGTSRSYVFRYMIDGKRRERSLGSASKITITQAKETADRMRQEIARGTMPVSPREALKEKTKASTELTFKEYAFKAIERRSEVKLWKSSKNKQQQLRSIEIYAAPVFGDKRLSEISRADVLAVLQPIWATKSNTASRLRGRLELIFRYAIADGLMEQNPALWRGNLEMDLPSPSKIKPERHLASMPFKVLQEKVRCFWPPRNRSRRAILFTILTASRTVESAFAKWEEIDWENKTWNVPPERRKDGKPYPHRVPLSTQAIDLLKSIERKSEYIFGSRPGYAGGCGSLSGIMKIMTNTNYTMHGFRSTFRDWCAENGVSSILAEKSLMHATGNAVVQAYQRSDLLEQRRPVMQAWADAVFSRLSSAD